MINHPFQLFKTIKSLVEIRTLVITLMLPRISLLITDIKNNFLGQWTQVKRLLILVVEEELTFMTITNSNSSKHNHMEVMVKAVTTKILTISNNNLHHNTLIPKHRLLIQLVNPKPADSKCVSISTILIPNLCQPVLTQQIQPLETLT